MVGVASAWGAAGTVTYTYDEAGRLKAAAYDNGTNRAYTLDPAGNRTQVAEALAGVLVMSSPSYTVSEATATVTITVNRTGQSTGAISVQYATRNGTATAGSDYTATSGTLNWASGDAAAKTFTVAILNDTATEGDETFSVALSAPTGGAGLGTPSAAGVTITDNDGVVLSISNVSVSEAAGTATLTVTKTGTTAQSTAVNYATSNGTATAGSDYTATSGTLTFLSTDTSKTFTVPITNDTTYEGNESFTATLSAPTNGATLGSAVATVTITENDAAPVFAISAASASEGAGTMTFTVTKTGSSALSHAVSYATTDGTATAGSDYTATSGTLTFLSTETSKTFTVPVLQDTLAESNETFLVLLNTPTNGATLGTASAAGTILDDDSGSNTSTLTIGYTSASGVWARGFWPGGGSIDPITLVGGKTYDTLEEFYYAGSPPYVPAISGTYITVAGFSSAPGSSWLTSISVGGVTAPSGATYSFDASTGKASWSWTGYAFNLPTSGTKTVVIVHQ
jgi:hypothetical protein